MRLLRRLSGNALPSLRGSHQPKGKAGPKPAPNGQPVAASPSGEATLEAMLMAAGARIVRLSFIAGQMRWEAAISFQDPHMLYHGAGRDILHAVRDALDSWRTWADPNEDERDDSNALDVSLLTEAD